LVDIAEVGREFLLKRGLAVEQIDTAFGLFQSFVRQAKTFYQSAAHLHFRASPLNYYYAFLNLAKALISIADPDSVNQRISHGLHHLHVDGPLRDQSIVTRQGVFPRFYHVLTGQVIPDNTRLGVISLLSYSTDIAYEFVSAGFGIQPILPAIFRIQRGNEGSHATLAIRDFGAAEARPDFTDEFFRHFEEVEFNKDLARAQFELYAEQKRSYRFFETRTQYPDDNNIIPNLRIAGDCRAALRRFYQSNPYSEEYCDFLLCLPLENTTLPFNEMLATYASMYYLGSLIRYFPRYLEQILASKDAWLIERFVKGSPITFLRHVSNMILGEDRIYSTR